MEPERDDWHQSNSPVHCRLAISGPPVTRSRPATQRSESVSALATCSRSKRTRTARSRPYRWCDCPHRRRAMRLTRGKRRDLSDRSSIRRGGGPVRGGGCHRREGGWRSVSLHLRALQSSDAAASSIRGGWTSARGLIEACDGKLPGELCLRSQDQFQIMLGLAANIYQDAGKTTDAGGADLAENCCPLRLEPSARITLSSVSMPIIWETT